jgi:hypothetical protein
VRPPAEPVPPALAGSEVGLFFSRLVRMRDGAYQQTMKKAVLAALGALTPETISTAARQAAELIGLADGGALSGRVKLAQMVLAPVSAALLFGAAPVALALLLATEGNPVGQLVAAIAPGADAQTVLAGNGAVVLLRQLIMDAGQEGVLGPLLQAAKAGAQGRAEEGWESRKATALDNAVGFLTQSFDATAGFVGNALLALGRLPQEAAAGLTDQTAQQAFLREVARHDPPVHNTRRFAGEALEFAGHALPAGSGLLLVLAAASHDPARYAHPQRFDPARENVVLPTFGGGRHGCPGQAIAFAAAGAALEALLPQWQQLAAVSQVFDAGAGVYRPLANARIPLFT